MPRSSNTNTICYQRLIDIHQYYVSMLSGRHETRVGRCDSLKQHPITSRQIQRFSQPFMTPLIDYVDNSVRTQTCFQSCLTSLESECFTYFVLCKLMIVNNVQLDTSQYDCLVRIKMEEKIDWSFRFLEYRRWAITLVIDRLQEWTSNKIHSFIVNDEYNHAPNTYMLEERLTSSCVYFLAFFHIFICSRCIYFDSHSLFLAFCSTCSSMLTFNFYRRKRKPS